MNLCDIIRNRLCVNKLGYITKTLKIQKLYKKFLRFLIFINDF